MGRLTMEQRMEMVSMKEQGSSYTELAQMFQVTRRTVIQLVKKHRSTSSVQDIHRSGRKRSTTVREDRLLIRSSLQNRRLTSSDLKRDLELYGIDLTARSVRNRLIEGGLSGRIAAKKPLLSEKNRAARLEFAMTHRDWTVEDWKKVLWSDESTVELFSSKRRVFVTRRPGERYKKECMVPSVHFGGGKLMVWGCFCSNGLGELRRVQGTMDQHSYKTMLIDAMIPSAERLFNGDQFIFQQDNAPCHKARSGTELLQERQISAMNWPAQSPDFNPIENLWRILKKKVGQSKPTNLNELWEKLQEAWRSITEEEITRLVNSMPQRIKSAIKNRGGSTKY